MEQILVAELNLIESNERVEEGMKESSWHLQGVPGTQRQINAVATSKPIPRKDATPKKEKGCVKHSCMGSANMDPIVGTYMMKRQRRSLKRKGPEKRKPRHLVTSSISREVAEMATNVNSFMSKSQSKSQEEELTQNQWCQ